MLAKFWGLNPKGPYVSLGKKKEFFCVVLTYSIKRARVKLQQRLRNVQKRVMHMEGCSIANLNLLRFCCSPVAVAESPHSCDPEIFLPW